MERIKFGSWKTSKLGGKECVAGGERKRWERTKPSRGRKKKKGI